MHSIKFYRNSGEYTVIPFPKGYSVTAPRPVKCQAESGVENGAIMARSIYQEDGTGLHYEVGYADPSMKEEGRNFISPQDFQNHMPDYFRQAFVENTDGKTVDVIGIS